MAMVKTPPLRTGGFFLLAAVVGVLVGLAGYGFRQALRFFQVFGLGDDPDGTIVEAARGLAAWERVLVPAAGGLLAALCLMLIKCKRGPFGITDTMDLVVTRKGGIRIRESLVQIVSSAFSISTGSSIGREAANSQLGTTAASGLGRLFRVSSRDRAVLLGCGVAAGMAVSYSAPLAGALFVMEVVLGNFAMDVFAPVVLSAVVATLVTDMVRQEHSLFGLYARGDLPNVGVAPESISMADPQLVLSALVLGCMCGFGAIGFRRVLQLGAATFRRMRLPLIVALPLGGAIVGAIGIWRPEVWGNGQDVVRGIILGDAAFSGIGMLVMIVVLKSVATSVSLSSGALGGTFTPNLVVGAAFGAVYAFGVGAVLPDKMPAPELQAGFALVGMAGLIAGTAHAPITAVLLVFEFTRNYELILPVMLCSITASVVARLVDRDSIYSARLRARGHMLAGGIEALAMQTNYVRDVMRRELETVLDTATFDEVMSVFSGARRDTVYVVDKGGLLKGHIHIHDVKFFLNEAQPSVVIAADLTRSAPAVQPDQTLAQIFDRFDDPDLEEIAVVASDDDPTLIGRLTRRDVIALLSDEVLGKRTLRAKLKAEGDEEASFVQLPSGAELARVAVPDALVGRALDSLDLAGAARLTVLVVIEMNAEGIEQRTLPEPEKVLEHGSALIVLGKRGDIEAFEKTVGGV